MKKNEIIQMINSRIVDIYRSPISTKNNNVDNEINNEIIKRDLVQKYFKTEIEYYPFVNHKHDTINLGTIVEIAIRIKLGEKNANCIKLDGCDYSNIEIKAVFKNGVDITEKQLTQSSYYLCYTIDGIYKLDTGIIKAHRDYFKDRLNVTKLRKYGKLLNWTL